MVFQKGVPKKLQQYKILPKYNDQIAKDIIAYYSIEPYYKDEKGKFVANDYPTLVKFCDKYNIDFWRLKDWLTPKNKKAYPELHKAWTKCLELALNFLLINSQKRLIDGFFAMFMLKNLYQWADRTDNKLNVQGKLGYGTMVRNIKERE